MNSAESILYNALKEIGSLYDIPENFPYSKVAKEFLPKLFYPIALSVRKTDNDSPIIYHS